MATLEDNLGLLIIRNVCFFLVNIITPPNLLLSTLLNVRLWVFLVISFLKLLRVIQLLLLMGGRRIIPILEPLRHAEPKEIHLLIGVVFLTWSNLHSVFLTCLWLILELDNCVVDFVGFHLRRWFAQGRLASRLLNCLASNERVALLLVGARARVMLLVRLYEVTRWLVHEGLAVLVHDHRVHCCFVLRVMCVIIFELKTSAKLVQTLGLIDLSLLPFRFLIHFIINILIAISLFVVLVIYSIVNLKLVFHNHMILGDLIIILKAHLCTDSMHSIIAWWINLVNMLVIVICVFIFDPLTVVVSWGV